MALNAMIALLSLFFILNPIVFVMAGKDEKVGKSDLDVSFVSSGSDWSKDLDGIKPYGPSAQSASRIVEYEVGSIGWHRQHQTFAYSIIYQ